MCLTVNCDLPYIAKTRFRNNLLPARDFCRLTFHVPLLSQTTFLFYGDVRENVSMLSKDSDTMAEAKASVHFSVHFTLSLSCVFYTRS